MKHEDYFDGLNPKWDCIKNRPEFRQMMTCMHSTRWHNEGSPWDHTILVVKNMCDLLKRDYILASYDIDEWHKEALLMAALYHDIAKPLVTKWDEKKKDWGAPNHSEEGAKLTRMILYDWEDVEQREYIVGLVRNHMVLHHILDGDQSKAYKKFYRFCGCDKVNIRYKHQCLLCMCDDFGSWCKEISIAEKIYTQNEILNLESIPLDNHYPAKNAPMQLVYNAKRDIYKTDRVQSTESDPGIDVYVMIGLPGSGKSTWIKNYAPDIPVVSRDAARVELGFCDDGEKYLGTKNEENKVTYYLEKKILDLAKEWKSFVIDNTNLRQKYRDRIHELLKYYPVNYIYVYIEAPTLEDNIKRRNNDFGDKSRGIIENMLIGFEFPYAYEYDQLIIDRQLPI